MALAALRQPCRRFFRDVTLPGPVRGHPLPIVLLVAQASASPLLAATEYDCGAGKPNKVSKHCDCPAGMVEKTDKQGTSRCKPAPYSPPSKPAEPEAPTEAHAETPPTCTGEWQTGPTCCPEDSKWDDATHRCVCTDGAVNRKAPDCPEGTRAVPGGRLIDPALAKPACFTIEPFCIDRLPATVGQVAAYCDKAGDSNCGVKLKFDSLCAWTHLTGHESHPANCISQDGAAAFCKSRGMRLATASEWRLAALGSDGRPYPWGNVPPNNSYVQASEDGSVTSPVGEHPGGASPFGVEDLVRPPDDNPAEWVLGGQVCGFHWEGRSSLLPGATCADSSLGVALVRCVSPTSAAPPQGRSCRCSMPGKTPAGHDFAACGTLLAVFALRRRASRDRR